MPLNRDSSIVEMWEGSEVFSSGDLEALRAGVFCSVRGSVGVSN